MLKDMFSVLLLIVITYSFNNQSSIGEFNSLKKIEKRDKRM